MLFLEEKMNHRYWILHLLNLSILFTIFGCTRNGVIAPSMPGQSASDAALQLAPGHQLWAYGQVQIDPDSMTYQVIPQHQVQGHLNVISALENNPTNDCFKVTKLAKAPNGDLLADITVTHPFMSMNLTGFDVRGIAMFNGSKSFPANNVTISDHSQGDGMLVNPDGYTSLYNPATAGNGSQGYIKGKLATGTAPTAIVNGYERYISNDPANTRNAFYAGDSITRTFEIAKPSGPFIFGYAVDASWAPPITKPVTDPMKDFGPEANAPDPWKIGVTVTPEGSGLTDQGGKADLSIDVYSIYPSQFTVSCEVPELFDSEVTTDTVDSTGTGFTEYKLTVENVKKATAGFYQALISVVNKQNPTSPAWMDLTAYQVESLQVIAATPDQPPVAAAKASPNPQTAGLAVTFSDNGSYDPDGTITKYEWDWDNNGTWDATGASVNHTWTTAGTDHVQFRVTDNAGLTAILASPMAITINPVPSTTWDNTIGAMLQSSCECHISSAPHNIHLDTYADAMASPGAISPGNPGASLIYTQVQNGNMPFLDSTQLQTLHDWIQAGAPEK